MSALSTDTGRPTPADPIPGVTKDRSIPSSEARNMPPELGTDAVAILEGRTFMYSDGVGDVAAGSIGGLVHADTRFLNRWTLRISVHFQLEAGRRGQGGAVYGDLRKPYPAASRDRQEFSA